MEFEEKKSVLSHANAKNKIEREYSNNCDNIRVAIFLFSIFSSFLISLVIYSTMTDKSKLRDF